MDTLFVFVAKYFILIPVLVLGWYFFQQEWPVKKNMAFFAIPAAILSYLFGLIATHLYYDPRPFVIGHFTPLLTHAADNGFPSDHTLLAAVLAMIGFYWNKRLGVVLWALALLIGIARVYVGVHHLIDIIGSIIIAIIGVSITYWLWKDIWHKEIM